MSQGSTQHHLLAKQLLAKHKTTMITRVKMIMGKSDKCDSNSIGQNYCPM